MKFITLFTLLLIAFVGYTSAQTCVGMPNNPGCTGPRDFGHRGSGCVARTMWYYNTRLLRCQPLNYLGCGGTNNRWCTLASCRQRCERR
ncbi:hypothetical protein DOY81_013088 [Sarcophaga bullata]|nr:hypothetical protein DOY81_013088 [Sarcophaga bullata]